MITVVIPMYNGEKTIVRTLNSVKRQSYLGKIDEVIIVNDGSTDNSESIVRNYAQENTKMPITLINKTNGGVSTARNAGLMASRSKYICLLDSDDEWLDNKIEEQLKIMEENDKIDLLGTTLNGQQIKRFLYKKFNYLTRISANDLVIKNYFQPSTVIFRKEILDKVKGFPEDQKYAEEGNFFIKASYYYNCYLLNQSYLNFGDGKHFFGDSGLSANLYGMQEGEIRNLNFARSNKFISNRLYYFAFVFSYVKYFRRIAIVKFRNLK